MGIGDKISNKTDEMKGKGKQSAGEASGNEQMQAEGKSEETGANAKQVGEKAKDTWKDATR